MLITVDNQRRVAPRYGETPVAGLSTKIVPQTRLHMLFYRAALPLSRQTLTFVSSLLRTHRKQLGSVWRKLNPGQQALLDRDLRRRTVRRGRRRFDVSTTTCWRYVNETVSRRPHWHRNCARRSARRNATAWPT